MSELGKLDRAKHIVKALIDLELSPIAVEAKNMVDREDKWY